MTGRSPHRRRSLAAVFVACRITALARQRSSDRAVAALGDSTDPQCRAVVEAAYFWNRELAASSSREFQAHGKHSGAGITSVGRGGSRPDAKLDGFQFYGMRRIDPPASGSARRRRNCLSM